MKLWDITKKTVLRTRTINRLEKQVNTLNARLGRLRSVNYKDEVFVPLAQALSKQIGIDSYEIIGPAGIGCTISIWFKKGRKSAYVSFRPEGLFEEGTIAVVDNSKDTGTYAKDSIGAINGLNHPEIQLSPDITIAQIAKYVGRS